MVLEERVSRLEGAYEQVDRRLDDLNHNVASLRAEVNSLRDEVRTEVGSLRAEVRTEIGGLRAEVNGRLNNLYVLIGGLWATMVAGFVALFIAG